MKKAALIIALLFAVVVAIFFSSAKGWFTKNTVQQSNGANNQSATNAASLDTNDYLDQALSDLDAVE